MRLKILLMNSTRIFLKLNGLDKIQQICKKKFYVSPFMDMETYYNFKLLNQKKNCHVSIKQNDKEGIVLTATFKQVKKEFTFKTINYKFF